MKLHMIFYAWIIGHDLLIVPGGGWNHKAEHGVRKQARAWYFNQND